MLDNFQTTDAVRMTSMTLVAFCNPDRKFPMPAGNCFTVATAAGNDYKILNFGWENLEHLLNEKTVAWPLKIHPLSERYAVLHDPRIPAEYYPDHFCETCTPRRLQPLPQRLRFDLRVQRGEISVTETEFGEIITYHYDKKVMTEKPETVVNFKATEFVGAAVMNLRGIQTGRFRSDIPNKSNTPKQGDR